jgi:hypothetical protein
MSIKYDLFKFRFLVLLRQDDVYWITYILGNQYFWEKSGEKWILTLLLLYSKDKRRIEYSPLHEHLS